MSKTSPLEIPRVDIAGQVFFESKAPRVDLDDTTQEDKRLLELHRLTNPEKYQCLQKLKELVGADSYNLDFFRPGRAKLLKALVVAYKAGWTLKELDQRHGDIFDYIKEAGLIQDLFRQLLRDKKVKAEFLNWVKDLDAVGVPRWLDYAEIKELLVDLSLPIIANCPKRLPDSVYNFMCHNNALLPAIDNLSDSLGFNSDVHSAIKRGGQSGDFLGTRITPQAAADLLNEILPKYYGLNNFCTKQARASLSKLRLCRMTSSRKITEGTYEKFKEQYSLGTTDLSSTKKDFLQAFIKAGYVSKLFPDLLKEAKPGSITKNKLLAWVNDLVTIGGLNIDRVADLIIRLTKPLLINCPDKVPGAIYDYLARSYDSKFHASELEVCIRELQGSLAAQRDKLIWPKLNTNDFPGQSINNPDVAAYLFGRGNFSNLRVDGWLKNEVAVSLAQLAIHSPKLDSTELIKLARFLAYRDLLGGAFIKNNSIKEERALDTICRLCRDGVLKNQYAADQLEKVIVKYCWNELWEFASLSDEDNSALFSFLEKINPRKSGLIW